MQVEVVLGRPVMMSNELTIGGAANMLMYALVVGTGRGEQLSERAALDSANAIRAIHIHGALVA